MKAGSPPPNSTTLSGPSGAYALPMTSAAPMMAPAQSNGGLLSMIPGFDPSGSQNIMSGMPDQHNRAFDSVGQVIGELIGSYFGGQPGGMAGGILGKKAGGGFGNIIAGRDAFNGAHGDIWDNLNPFSKYGAASIGQSLNMAEPPGGMSKLGGAPGGLPLGGMGGPPSPLGLKG